MKAQNFRRLSTKNVIGLILLLIISCFAFLYVNPAISTQNKRNVTFTEESQIYALEAEIREIMDEKFEIDPSREPRCLGGDALRYKDTSSNAVYSLLTALLTSPHADDLTLDQLLEILKTETVLPIKSIIQSPSKENYAFLSVPTCGTSAGKVPPSSQIYFLAHDLVHDDESYVEFFKWGLISNIWTFPDGIAISVYRNTSYVTGRELIRTYKDQDVWLANTLVVDPSPYPEFEVTFDEEGENFSMYGKNAGEFSRSLRV